MLLCCLGSSSESSWSESFLFPNNLRLAPRLSDFEFCIYLHLDLDEDLCVSEWGFEE